MQQWIFEPLFRTSKPGGVRCNPGDTETAGVLRLEGQTHRSQGEDTRRRSLAASLFPKPWLLLTP